MSKPKHIGVVLINIGTPASPQPQDIGRFLKEFLMDPYVIDIPFFFRWLLVNGIIVPFRSKSVAKLYQNVWRDKGSPLRYHSEDLAKQLQSVLGDCYRVSLAMRYGSPSIEEATQMLLSQGVEEILYFPMYPQYSLAATESSLEESKRVAAKHAPRMPAHFGSPFYDKEEFIEAFVSVARPQLERVEYDHVLFSYHGLPKKQVQKLDNSHAHCLIKDNCCAQLNEHNKDCYRAQCFETSRKLAKRLSIEESNYTVCFQSRLSKAWIEPFTDGLYKKLPTQGKTRIVVFCPSFVADCLETLDEVSLRGKRMLEDHGGKEIHLIPSLNSNEAWVNGLKQLIQSHV